jgi:hypothetical protein
MAQQGKKSSKGEKNDDRRCRKAWKKIKGVSPKAHNGKSADGYSLKPELILARAVRKETSAAKRSARATKASAA